MKVNYNKKSSAETIEQNLLAKVLEKAIEKMSEDERKEIIRELDLKVTNFIGQAITGALQFILRQGGFKSYQILVIVANAVVKTILGRGLSLGANAALTRGLSVFIGPIGWAITGAWTAISIAGPAYRVTIPAVIQIAFLRSQKQYKDL